MIVRFFDKFDDHCIIYFAMIGFVLGLFNTPPNPGPAAFGMVILGGFSWYIGKAIFITNDTAVNWKDTHPGEPMIRAGGLTCYDEAFVKAVGEATAAAAKNEVTQ